MRAELRSRCRSNGGLRGAGAVQLGYDSIGIVEIALLYGGMSHLQQPLQHFLSRSLQRRTGGSRLLGLI